MVHNAPQKKRKEMIAICLLFYYSSTYSPKMISFNEELNLFEVLILPNK